MQNSKLQLKIKSFYEHKNAGFTLFELLLTIAILGILTGIVVMLINPNLQLQKGRDSQRKSDLRQIQSALEMYRSDIGEYPAAVSSALPANCNSGTSFGNVSCTTIYLQRNPVDPKTGTAYSYSTTGSPPRAYSVKACLENVNDNQKDSVNSNPPCTGGTTNWSYTLQNP